MNNTTTKKPLVDGKKYLQNELLEYLKGKDVKHLYNIAYIVVKKTCLHYAKSSTRGYNLYLNACYKNTKNADILDLKQECIKTIIEDLTKNNDDVDANVVIKNAFSGVNKYLYSLRSVKVGTQPFNYSIEELTDDGFNLVNVRGGIYELIKNGERLNYSDEVDDEKTTKERELLYNILKELTPQQKQIAKLLSLGYTQRQIAEKLNKKSVGTISDHVAKIKKIANKIKNNI